MKHGVSSRKRRLAVGLGGLVVTIGLCAGFASAAIAPGTFTGHVEPSGRAEVTIQYKHQHGRVLRSFDWRLERVPLKCTSGPAVARDGVGGGESRGAHARRFGMGEISGGPGQPPPEFSAFSGGHIAGKDEIAGYVTIHGTQIPLRGGGTDRCHSGRLHWTATR